MEIEVQIKLLSEKITECNKAYAENGDRLIPDSEYDAMLEELKTLDPENPLCSIQDDVGTSGSSGKYSYGDNPMLSLNKVYSIKDAVKWMKSLSRTKEEWFILQPKYDGLSGCLNSLTKMLCTRGNGFSGEIISQKLDMIRVDKWVCSTANVGAAKITYGGSFNARYMPKNKDEIRGEIIISKGNFKRIQESIFKKDGEKYKNPRNCVSGLCNPAMSELDNAKIIMELSKIGANISFVAHDEIGFYISLFSAGSDTEVENMIASIWDHFKTYVPYEQDGLVITLADKEYARSLGNTSHHPRGSIAVKENENGVMCKLEGIEWTVGASGEITPTYQVEKTFIQGVDISHVLGHNFKNLQVNDVRIGTTEIEITRGGNVIPFAIGYDRVGEYNGKVFETSIGLKHRMASQSELDDNRIYKFVNTDVQEVLLCPCCESPIIYDAVESPDCFCSNNACHDRIMKRLYNACSKCFEVKGLAESTLDKIYEKYKVTKFFELLMLDPEQFAQLEGFASKSANILYDAIHAVTKCSDVQVLASLGIPMIGMRASADVLKEYTISELISITESEISAIKGFGPEKAKSLVKGLREYSCELTNLIGLVEMSQTKGSTSGTSGDGTASQPKPTICFTGEAPLPRSKCQAIAIANGYAISNSVTKGLSILVCADAETNSTKAQKARKYSIPVIPFSQWFDSLKNKSSDKSTTAKMVGDEDPLVNNIFS